MVGVVLGMRVIWLVFAVFVVLMGCSGNKTQQESEIPRYLSVGDSVFVKTNDSSEYEFEVVEISDSAIIGESITIPLKDIYALRVKNGDVVYETTGKQIGDAFKTGAMVILLTPIAQSL